jgi:hypothetical protein
VGFFLRSVKLPLGMSRWARLLRMGEDKANMLGSVAMARRRDRDEPPDVLSAEEIKELRHRIAHLSPDAVQRLYERAFEDCRLVYSRIPSPRKMQTLVQLWKQLWMWR